MKEREKAGCGWSTAGALSAALLMVTPHDGWRGLALRELLPCHGPSARLPLLENDCTDRKVLLLLTELTSKTAPPSLVWFTRNLPHSHLMSTSTGFPGDSRFIREVVRGRTCQARIRNILSHIFRPQEIFMVREKVKQCELYLPLCLTRNRIINLNGLCRLILIIILWDEASLEKVTPLREHWH